MSAKNTLSTRLLAILGVQGVNLEAEETSLVAAEEPAAGENEPSPEDATSLAQLTAQRAELEAASAQLVAEGERLTAELAALADKANGAEQRSVELQAALTAATATAEPLPKLTSIVQNFCANMSVALGLGCEKLEGAALVARFEMLNHDFVARFPVGGVSKTDAGVVTLAPAAAVDSRSQRAVRATNLR